MARPPSRELEVIGAAYVTPHMLRLTLGGSGMAGFPAEQESAYVKLLFPQGEDRRPLMRTYTIRHQRAEEIDIDFVIHDHTGPASSWAQGARQGDRIEVAGPGSRKLINPDADWFLLAGDMTALPAISVNLEMLPETARGYAVLSVVDEADIQPLECPAGIDIHWLVNPEPQEEGSAIREHIDTLPRLEGQPSIWCASEFAEMRQLRQYFRRECPVPNSHRYISSYWKKGASEDRHKVIKRQDAGPT
ncbi:siderophore-interacting protein [Microbulbifer halophilus]|uniref:Siderophore-interacting protein n=1 Tax=Microbulbifer halophilus TaxID=453963 RepID=A0ABW5EJZ0_9GAMM|nr:siderophore-interacting protein [Microbulbifer halophilus]MCW8128252.1 siderophore-interacting protein [Microbulbifer halophilus]